MKSKKLVCRVCGRSYEGCKSANVGAANKWKNITCSTECYKEYIKKIHDSRNVNQVNEESKVIDESKVLVLDHDYSILISEDEFDDTEDNIEDEEDEFLDSFGE